jgi:L,D-transpeptidase catalytic domain
VRDRRFRLFLILPLVAIASACGSVEKRAGTPDAAAIRDAESAREVGGTRPSSEARRCSSSPKAVGSDRVSVLAVVRSRALAYRRPGGRVFARFGRLNVNGFPTVFGVLAVVPAGNCSPRWYRVQLPIKPNGVTGFVRARAVDTARVGSRVLVDLSARRLTLFRNGRRVLIARVAVGSPATPTPLGRYYVNQRLLSGDPSGPFGPAAIGISAYSTVLTGWVQGGPIAIHGTNEPWSIGRAVSNGCIRVRNDVLRRLFEVTPAGTPVTVRR